MKKLIFLIVAIVVLGLIFVSCFSVVPPADKGKPDDGCTTITSGDLVYGNTAHYLYGEPLPTGYDVFGYNYQSHIFNGWYENVTPIQAPVEEGDTWLIMKWNDAWLSNKDCDNDLLLDRPDNIIGSGAWCTNHQSGEYVIDGKICKWNYFVKIVAVPEGAYKDGGVWYTADDIQIGEVIWGSFAIIQQVENDLCADLHGVQYHSPASPGLGKF